MGEDRDTKSVEVLIGKTFTAQQCQAMNTVSMDMWKPYINSVGNKLPNAEIVHNKFHLIKYLNECIDKIRRREVKDNEVLKDSRYALLKNKENLTEKQKEKYETIKEANLEVTKAWHIRENFKSLFDYYNEEKGATELLKYWVQASFMNNIKEVNKVIMMFLNQTKGVVNALISNLNNAMAERLNGKIQELKVVDRGYRFKKYQNYEKIFKENRPQSSNNGKVIRYADVLLMQAEALIMSNDVSGGMALINRVRSRVGAYTINGVSGQGEAMTILKRERHLELCGEQIRWRDLVRWGDAKALLRNNMTILACSFAR